MQNSYLYRQYSLLFAGITIALATILLYYIPRSSFDVTFLLVLLLFIACFFLIKKENIFSLRFCIGLAVALRVVALFSMPALSDDYFRFIWDGKMSLMNIHPFQYTPTEFLASHPSTMYLKHLYNGMNSQEYHTVYPAVMQFFFVVAAYLGNGSDWFSVFVMKLFILGAELGSIRILLLFVKKYELPERNILWYILNPLIIIELTGNCHFEAVFVFFTLLFFYFILDKKILYAAIFFSLAVSTKLIPLMLLPLVLRYLGLRKFFTFAAISLFAGILLFLPLFNVHLVTGMKDSLRLFFHVFEFNASVFYFIRWIGYFYVNYDVIEEVAPVLGVISFFGILLISWWPSKKYSFIEKALWIFSIYFLFSTMMHPWYTSILILLAAISRFRFPIVFSLLILLSYYPYSLIEYDEDKGLWLIAIEYGILFIFILYEIWKLKKKPTQSLF